MSRCIQKRNGNHGDAGKLYCGKFVGPQESIHKVGQIGSSSVVLKYFVQDNLERPRLQQISDRFTQDGKKAKSKRCGMRPQQRPYCQAFALF